LKVFLILDF